MNTHLMTAEIANSPRIKRVNIALIGAGGISQSQHLPNLLRAPHVRLTTVCDLSEALLDEAVVRFPGQYATTNHHREVLADPDVEAVLIATKPDNHVSLTLEALAAGKHVYVEKPLSETEQEAQQVVAAQEKANRLVAIGFNRRLSPAYQRAKALIQKHGGAKNIHYRLSDAYWIWGKEMPPGVRLIHEVCHVFDLLRFFTDSEVQSVYCVDSRPDDEIITLKFTNGCVASIMDTGYVHYDMPKERLEVITERGGLTVDDFTELHTFSLPNEARVEHFAGHTHPERDHVHRFLFASGGAQAMMDTRRAYYDATTQLEKLTASGNHSEQRTELEQYIRHHAPHINYMMDKGWIQAVDHFAQCILSGVPCMLSDAIGGLRASQITAAALKSRETGQAVQLNCPC